MIYHDTENEIEKVGQILKNGGIAAIPTETVYGLAANAYDGAAVRKIFEAKHRPCDNPLIVHIASLETVNDFAVPNDRFYKLAQKFLPGPLTMILPKKGIIPKEVSAGLETVAVRFPSHKTAQKIIRAAGVPLAAPSANLSGSPSPTTAQHVVGDFGSDLAVVDAGPCLCGVESTVVSLVGDLPVLLRPGFVTLEQLAEVLPDIVISDGVLNALPENEKPLSPGLKHKHYAPKASAFGVRGSTERAARYINGNSTKNTVVVCFDGEQSCFEAKTIPYGKEDKPEQLAAHLFAALRQADEEGADKIFIRVGTTSGVGLAVYNRLLRATSFNITDTDRK